MSDVLLSSAFRLAERIRYGELTSVAVVEAHIARLRQVNPVGRVPAWIDDSDLSADDRARASDSRADGADRRRQDGDRASLGRKE